MEKEMTLCLIVYCAYACDRSFDLQRTHTYTCSERSRSQLELQLQLANKKIEKLQLRVHSIMHMISTSAPLALVCARLRLTIERVPFEPSRGN